MITYSRVVSVLALCCICLSVFASVEREFFVKYKDHSNCCLGGNTAEANKCFAEMRLKLTEEKLDKLADAATKALYIAEDNKITHKVQVKYVTVYCFGAYLVRLSEELDEKQVEWFINNVKQDNNIEYIERNRMVHSYDGNNVEQEIDLK